MHYIVAPLDDADDRACGIIMLYVMFRLRDRYGLAQVRLFGVGSFVASGLLDTFNGDPRMYHVRSDTRDVILLQTPDFTGRQTCFKTNQ
jgi:hypothetical protein